MLSSLKGWIGEAKISLLLKWLHPEEYTVLHNILLPTEDGRTSQIDHIIVSPYGIFVIETKNYKGWIFGDESSKYWTQVLYKRKEQFYNPIRQNAGHIKTLKHLLHHLYDGPFYSYIVFSSKATLKKVNVTSEHVSLMYSLQVIRHVKAHQDIVIPKAKIKGIVYKLEKFNRSGREHHKAHIESVRKTQQEVASSVEICPKCGGDLVARNSNYGSFLGCSQFPKCRFVRK